MPGRESKKALFDGLASVAKALGNGQRAQLVDVLAQGERSVDKLATELGESVANTSHHLQRLLRTGLVRTRRDGNRIIYRLAGPQVETLWAAISQVAAEHVAELDQLAADYLGDRSALEVVTREQLHRRLREGDVVVLDVRPAAEFAAGHITGAVSVPVEQLTRRLRGVRKNKDVVAYCRGPYCVYADDAVRALTRRGYRAARLEDGYPEWARAGLPVERERAEARKAGG